MADLKSKAKEVLKKGQDVASQVPQAIQDFRSLGDVLKAAGSGSAPKVGPAEPWTLSDFMAALDSGVRQAKGYYTGYVEPKIKRTLRDLFY